MPDTLPPLKTSTVSDLAEFIKHYCREGEDGRAQHAKVTFLLGAGFSRSAGIPTANEIVQNNLRPHPLLKKHLACPPDVNEYVHLMRKLSPAERGEIIKECIRGAYDQDSGRTRINWAHLLLATMVERGFVKRILTTNFDPLIIDAMALTGVPVRAFDLAMATWFTGNTLEHGSVIYLHGQVSGLILSNTPEETDIIRPHLNTVFQDAFSDSIVVVVGYSGECDPVLEELDQRFQHFRHGLYWIGYKNEEPSSQARSFLTRAAREAFFVPGYDADTFMRDLALRELKLTLPPLVRTPFHFAADTLRRVMPFPIDEDAGPGDRDPVAAAFELVMEAAEPKGETDRESNEVEGPPKELIVQVSLAAAARDSNKLLAFYPLVKADSSEAAKRMLGDAFSALIWQTAQNNDFESAKKFIEYAEELGTTNEAWLANRSGLFWAAQAQTKSGPEADQMWKKCCEMYERALELEPKMHAAANNLGAALNAQAQTKSGAVADELWSKAYKVYAKVLEIKADKYEAANNWGYALESQARKKTGEEAERLWALAYEKYAKALEIKPNFALAINNYANALESQANRSGSKKAAELRKRAAEIRKQGSPG